MAVEGIQLIEADVPEMSRLSWITQEGPMQSQGLLEVKEGDRRVSVREGNVKREASARVIRGRGLGQGVQVASRSWQRQGHECLPRASRRNIPADTLILGLQTSRTVSTLL